MNNRKNIPRAKAISPYEILKDTRSMGSRVLVHLLMPTSITSKPRARGASAMPLPLTVSRPELLVNGSDYDFRAVVHGLLASPRASKP
jgi:hypothetical protein